MIEIQIVYLQIIYTTFALEGIYKTTVTKQISKQNKTKTKKRKTEGKKKVYRAGFEPGTFSSTQLHLTTTTLKMMTYNWQKVFNLIPFS